MSQQTGNEKMAVMVEDRDTARMGGTTKEPEDEEEATGILSVRSKGKGKEIKISGVNYDIDEELNSELNSYAVPGPALVGLQKETHRPEVKSLDTHKLNTVHSYKQEHESNYAENQKRSLQPRPETLHLKSVPLKKRISPYHQTLQKTHSEMVKKDLRDMKVKIDDEVPVIPTAELKQLLESMVKSCIQKKTIIEIDGEPHHLTATPVSDVQPHIAGGGMEDLYCGIIDRPPPSTSYFVRNHGLEGPMSNINIPEDSEEDIYMNSIVSYQTDDPTQYPGELETSDNRFVYSENAHPNDSWQQFDPNYNAACKHYEEFVNEDSYIDHNDQPLDLSHTSKTGDYYQLETEATTRGDAEQLEMVRDDVVTLPAVCDNKNANQPYEITNQPTQQLVFNQQQLMLFIAQNFERLKMKTPEPRDGKSTMGIPPNTQSQDTKKLTIIPENIPDIEQHNHERTSMPNLLSLDMTNSDGSVKESSRDIVKRKLKNKLKNS